MQTYWGQFDCMKCLKLKQIRYDLSSISDTERLNRLRLSERNVLVKELLYHRIVNFPNAINTN